MSTWGEEPDTDVREPVVRLKIALPCGGKQRRLDETLLGPRCLLTGSKDLSPRHAHGECCLLHLRRPISGPSLPKGATHGDALAVPAAQEAYAEFLVMVRARQGT